MNTETIPGITAETVTTDRLSTRVLFSGPEDGIPVLFIHGNFSSATWWEETMVSLPPEYRAIAPDLRGFGGSDPAVKVNAQIGMRDFVEDAIALMNQLGYDRFHLVGNSLGGLVVWWMMADESERLISVTRLRAPVLHTDSARRKTRKAHRQMMTMPDPVAAYSTLIYFRASGMEIVPRTY